MQRDEHIVGCGVLAGTVSTVPLILNWRNGGPATKPSQQRDRRSPKPRWGMLRIRDGMRMMVRMTRKRMRMAIVMTRMRDGDEDDGDESKGETGSTPIAARCECVDRKKRR